MKIIRYIQLQLRANHRKYVTLEPQHQTPEKAIEIISRLNYGNAPYGCVYYLDSTCIVYSQEQAPEQITTLDIPYDPNYRPRN